MWYWNRKKNERVKKLFARIFSEIHSGIKIGGIYGSHIKGLEREASIEIHFENKYVLKFNVKDVEFGSSNDEKLCSLKKDTERVRAVVSKYIEKER